MINQCTCGGLSGRGPKWCDYCVSRMEKHSVAMEWQPIETAPATPPDEDPIPIIVWVMNSSRPDEIGRPVFGKVYVGRDGNRHPRADGHSRHGWEITHWMPLPEPPQ